VKARSAGEKCPICSGARVILGINDLATTNPELAEEWSDRNGLLSPTMFSAGSHKKIIWRGKCGHEWTAAVKSRTQGSGCPYCSHNRILPGFNDLASVYPELAGEWSEKNLPLLPTMVTPFANRKVWWRCRLGHEWNTLISTRSAGSRCPYCSGILLLKGFNDFASCHPRIAEEWSERNLPLLPDEVNEKSRKNVWWKCNTNP
jgi:DNA-directed RNA polymerase subunit RPC12/RpoP